MTGTTSKRRNEEIKRLNNLYLDVVREKQTLQKSIKHLAQTESYRMLKDWTYDVSAAPIEGIQGSTGQPDFTDVCGKMILLLLSMLIILFSLLILLGREGFRK